MSSLIARNRRFSAQSQVAYGWLIIPEKIDLYGLIQKMTTEKFLPYARQSIDEEDIAAVVRALRSGEITRGREVEAFEGEIASYTGAQYAVAFSSGSSALSAAYQAAHICSQDRVITTPNTFVATVAAAKKAGAKILVSDIDSYGNLAIDPLEAVLNRPSSRGKTFLVPVHFAGVACDMERLSYAITSPDVIIIEDAAHALGSLYPDGSRVGSCRFSEMTILSFHPAKNITTGEGGMVTTNSETLYRRLKTIRNSGIERERLTHRKTPAPCYYEVHEISSNFHMTEFQAALGRSQLKRIEQFREKKSELLQWYREKLSGLPGVVLPRKEADERTFYHLFVVRIQFDLLGIDRTEFMNRLKDFEIGSQLHYVPLYYHPALGLDVNVCKRDCCAMEEYFQTALSLPFFVDMQEGDVERVAMALRRIILLSR